MFTGIVERSVPVVAAHDHESGRRLSIAVRWGDEKAGDSIAVNGCCLTVAGVEEDRLDFDVVAETLDRTNLGRLVAGDLVHVERPLRAGDRIDGHFVQGHVDGTATLIDRRADVHETRLRLRVHEILAAFIVPKGSVCLDGVSLTVAALEGNEFEVVLIPTTLQRTALGRREIGWPMNFEADILVKTIATATGRLAQNRA